MGNQMCAGFCGQSETEQRNNGEVRGSFIQKDLQKPTETMANDDYDSKS